MNLFKKVISHELVSGSFYIFIGSMVANIFAFLLNLFLARSLSYADYAIFASLLSLINLAAIPANSINTIIVKFATKFFVDGQSDVLKSLYLIFSKLLVGISIFIIVASVILANPLSNYLHIDNSFYVIAVGFTIATFYLNMLNTAFLQSLLKFKFISFINSVGGALKLVFGVLLVMLGFRAFSGIWAIFIMTLGMYFVALLPLSKILKTKAASKKINLNKKDLLFYSFPTFMTILFLTSFTSTDVILVKHFFNPHLAGFYAGLALIGKVIFYFTAPIPLVMFPLLVKRHTTGKSFVNLFYLSLVLVSIPSIAISTFYFMFPNLVINLFLGGRDYIYISRYLGIFGIYLTIFSMVNVCVNFFLSLNKTKIAYPVVAAAIFQIVLINFFHKDFYEVIGVSLIVTLVLLVFLLLIFFKNYGNLQKIRENVVFLNSPGV